MLSPQVHETQERSILAGCTAWHPYLDGIRIFKVHRRKLHLCDPFLFHRLMHTALDEMEAILLPDHLRFKSCV